MQIIEETKNGVTRRLQWNPAPYMTQKLINGQLITIGINRSDRRRKVKRRKQAKPDWIAGQRGVTIGKQKDKLRRQIQAQIDVLKNGTLDSQFEAFEKVNQLQFKLQQI